MKQISARKFSLHRLTVVAAAFVVAGAILTAHVFADRQMPSNMTSSGPVVAAVTATPMPTLSPSPTAAPTPAPTPAPTKVPAQKRVVTTVKTVPAVTPVPSSSVDHLVPVTSAVPPSPGLGSGNAPAAARPTYTSTNWAGYLTPAQNVTAVSGSWKVPTPTGNGTSTTADTAWVGIGGVTSDDLIQTGTTNFVSRSGRVTTQAFYELLPDSATNISSMTVMPGDVMAAEIHLISGNLWQINLTNVTRSQTFSLDVTYTSTKSSAEWIEEDPSFADGSLVPFDQFGSISFTNAMTTIGGVTYTMAASGAQAIMLVDSNNQPLGTPSVISSDGQSFSVTGG